MNQLLFLPLFTPEESFSVGLPNPEIRFEPIEGVFHAARHVLAHRFCGFLRCAGCQHFRESLVSPGRSLIRRWTSDAEPRRSQSMRFFNCETERRAAGSFGNLPMQFF